MSGFAADTLRRLEAITDPAARFRAAGELQELDVHAIRCAAVLDLYERRAAEGARYGAVRGIARELGIHEATATKMLRRARQARGGN